MPTIEERVKKVVSQHLGIAAADVKPAHHFVNDLGADSIDQVELVMGIEDEFELAISAGETYEMVTVQKVLDYVKAHVPA